MNNEIDVHPGMVPGSHPRMPPASHHDPMSQDPSMQHFPGQQPMYPGGMQGPGPRPSPGQMLPGQPNMLPGHQQMRIPGMRPPGPPSHQVGTQAQQTSGEKAKLLAEKPLLIQELLDQVSKTHGLVDTI